VRQLGLVSTEKTRRTPAQPARPSSRDSKRPHATAVKRKHTRACQRRGIRAAPAPTHSKGWATHGSRAPAALRSAPVAGRWRMSPHPCHTHTARPATASHRRERCADSAARADVHQACGKCRAMGRNSNSDGNAGHESLHFGRFRQIATQIDWHVSECSLHSSQRQRSRIPTTSEVTHPDDVRGRASC
jgi:hypothetical protein